MAEGQLLFTLDHDRFNEIRQQSDLCELREEFHTRNADLSLSLLISPETDTYWLLVDFEKKKTYNIRKENETTVEISEGSDMERQTDILSDAGTILQRLREGLGTHIGLIDALQRLNFDKFDIDNLRRSDLSVRRLSFESVYPELLDVYKMLREMLTSLRESLISLPSTSIRRLKDYILQFYDMTVQIMGFEVRDTDAREQHTNLLRRIRSFRESVKQALLQDAAYLSSRAVDQLENQVKTTLASAEERLNTTINTEAEKLQTISEEAQQKEKKRQESFDQLYIQLQNQLTEKPISQYKTTFNDQAKKHAKTAQNWLLTTVGLTLLSSGIYWWILKDLIPASNDLPTILPNLLAKGFFFSLIYLLLNRSIKNYTAEKHLEVINVHRQNALETVDPFLDATKENRETRDQILLAATKTIYDANQSGYLSGKTSGSDNTSPVQQIIKEVIPTKSSDKSD